MGMHASIRVIYKVKEMKMMILVLPNLELMRINTESPKYS
jgi:hypothetical protein